MLQIDTQGSCWLFCTSTPLFPYLFVIFPILSIIRDSSNSIHSLTNENIKTLSWFPTTFFFLCTCHYSNDLLFDVEYPFSAHNNFFKWNTLVTNVLMYMCKCNICVYIYTHRHTFSVCFIWRRTSLAKTWIPPTSTRFYMHLLNVTIRQPVRVRGISPSGWKPTTICFRFVWCGYFPYISNKKFNYELKNVTKQ